MIATNKGIDMKRFTSEQLDVLSKMGFFVIGDSGSRNMYEQFGITDAGNYRVITIGSNGKSKTRYAKDFDKAVHYVKKYGIQRRFHS